MVFGFGFNKVKVLASAEKNVKAGKLFPAIADYEKILRHDPHDLSALNTVGDLYASAGDAARATACFRQVAQSYASAGFAVKAIAIYRKLVRHNPSAALALVQLADLYAAQRQPGEASAHYRRAADAFSAAREPANAASALLKALELDPENPPVLERLRELLPPLGRSAELCDLYLRAAQNHHRRREPDECRQALARALELDPAHPAALLLAAEFDLEAGDPQQALRSLRGLAALDSRAEALRLAVAALLQLGDTDQAAAASASLLARHKDWSGFASLEAWCAGRADYRPLVALCLRHANELLAADAARFTELLDRVGSAMHDDRDALASLLPLLEAAGDPAALARALARLAAACQRDGDPVRARELYARLAELEPDNAAHREQLHLLSQPAQTSTDDAPATDADITPAAPAESSLANHDAIPEAAERDDLLLSEDELRFVSAAAPARPEPDSIGAALTDADLYAAYRLPEKAIQILEDVRPQAPRHLRIHHQLAALYVQVGRPADAARCYALLAELCTEQGHPQGVAYYRQCAARCRAEAQPAAPPELPRTGSSLQEVCDEAQFYLSQGMVEETAAALRRAEALTPGDDPALAALRQRLHQAPSPELPEFTSLPGPPAGAELPPPAMAAAVEPLAAAAPLATPIPALPPAPAVRPPAAALTVNAGDDRPASGDRPAPDEVDLLALAAGEDSAAPHEVAPLEGSLLPIEAEFLPPPAGASPEEADESEELLDDGAHLAPLEPPFVLFPPEVTEADWHLPVAAEGAFRSPAKPSEASEIDPGGDFAALFAPPVSKASTPRRRRRKP